MQAIARIAISMFLVSSAFAAYHTSAKLRRDGLLNLYPFPRVGRAHHTWQVPLNDFYLEYKPSEKRQLYAFPRVGRSEPFDPDHPNSDAEIRSKSSDTGMWFGPRLGRSYKSEQDAYQTSNEHSDPEHVYPEFIEERKKRQTKQ